MPKKSKKKGVAPPAAMPGPPTVGAPEPPKNWKPRNGQELQDLRKLTDEQKKKLPAVAAEMAASKGYATDFGSNALPQAVVTALFANPAAWALEESHATSWQAYSHEQEKVAADILLGNLETIQKDFDASVQHDPLVADRYPSLGAFIQARSAPALRAAATRHENEKKAALAEDAEEDATPATTTPEATTAVKPKS